jgi:formylglycine-generating enzyme required for sulfatase activity
VKEIATKKHKKNKSVFIPLFFLCFFVAIPSSAQDVTSNMAKIPAGDFWMGRTYNWLLDELDMHLRPRLDDQPVHLVSLDAFWIDKYEVTNGEYARFTEATGRRKPYHWIGGKVPAGREKFPVYNVTWDDAVAYCQSVGKRLPTEAEWERAARGGVEKAMFPWGAELGARRGGEDSAAGAEPPAKRARYGFPNGPAAVGSFAPNGFGLYDVTGNLWEWVADWYGQNYYAVSPDKNPQGPPTGLYRVIRGGGWSDVDERILALHYRNFTNQDLPSSTVGIRCARSQ